MTTLEVLQLCLIGQRSGKIECSHSGISGTLHLVSGQVIHAECGQASPEDAFFDLVGVAKSEGTYIPGDHAPQRTIFQQTDFLLMEAARRADEVPEKKTVPETAEVSQLIVISDPVPKVFDLSSSRITVGRSLDNQVILSVDSVSGHHCELTKVDSAYWIRDLQSRNGTFVNNRQISDPIKLQTGDLIQLGAALLKCASGEMTPAAIKRKTARIHESDTQLLLHHPNAHPSQGSIRFQNNAKD